MHYAPKIDLEAVAHETGGLTSDRSKAQRLVAPR
jgi:hypothetical protein